MNKWNNIFISYIHFYEKYHSEKINQLIHLIGIPAVYWTILVITSHPTFSLQLIDDDKTNIFLQASTQLNITLFVVVSYIICYALFTPRLTFIYILVFLFLGWTANISYLIFEDILWIAIPLHILGWIAQFIGHGIFEKKKPALLDNIVQAFLVAPW